MLIFWQAVQTWLAIQFGHVRVKALTAKRPVALLHGTDVDDVAGYDLAAPGTTGLLRLADLDSLHGH